MNRNKGPFLFHRLQGRSYSSFMAQKQQPESEIDSKSPLNKESPTQKTKKSEAGSKSQSSDKTKNDERSGIRIGPFLPTLPKDTLVSEGNPKNSTSSKYTFFRRSNHEREEAFVSDQVQTNVTKQGWIFRRFAKSKQDKNNSNNLNKESIPMNNTSSTRSRFLWMWPQLKTSGEERIDTEVSLAEVVLSTKNSSRMNLNDFETQDSMTQKVLKIIPSIPGKSNNSSSSSTISSLSVQKAVKADYSYEMKNPSDNRQNNTTNIIFDTLMGLPSFAMDSWETLTTLVRNNNDEEWVIVCPKTKVSPGAIVPVVAGGINLLIIASNDGKRVYCVANSCPHLGTPLETGSLEVRPCEASSLDSVKVKSLSTGGMVSSPTAMNPTDEPVECCIVCPLHRTAFALETGEVRGPWCPYPPLLGTVIGLVKPASKLPTFGIRTRGKNIEVLISSRLDEVEDRIKEK